MPHQILQVSSTDDPDADDYRRYCIDEAVAVAGVQAENRAERAVRREAEERDKARGSEDRPSDGAVHNRQPDASLRKRDREGVELKFDDTGQPLLNGTLPFLSPAQAKALRERHVNKRR
jgi:hypothetical protein